MSFAAVERVAEGLSLSTDWNVSNFLADTQVTTEFVVY
jgi:hypothetical protein